MNEDLREKVIRGLECIISSGNAGMRDDCANCIYPGGGDCLAPALRDALALLKAQEPRDTAYWIHCDGKSHIWYCSHCGEKINYNNAHKTYNKGMKPIEQVNRYCRGCGFTMTSRPTDEQREAVKW